MNAEEYDITIRYYKVFYDTFFTYIRHPECWMPHEIGYQCHCCQELENHKIEYQLKYENFRERHDPATWDSFPETLEEYWDTTGADMLQTVSKLFNGPPTPPRKRR